MGDMSRFRLQEKQQVAVFLSSVVVGENAFQHLGCVFEVACYFVLL